jgi:ribonuclease HII
VFCGVDEAGKGAVLGPMVVAGVGCEDLEEIASLGVRDSKLLSPARREELYAVIRARFPIAVLVIPPDQIDHRGGTMNRLMVHAHAKVINELHPEIAYVDACDVIAARYGCMVGNRLEFSCRVIAEHHADENRPLVSAASIVAKVTRDAAIKELSAIHGEIGSGYPSDPATVRYLEAFIGSSGSPPPFARKTWNTIHNLIAKAEQATLPDFS